MPLMGLTQQLELTRKGKTGLCMFPFPLEIRSVTSGIFPAFDISKEKVV